MIFIEGNRCRIRSFTENDLDDFMAYRNNMAWMKHQGFKGLTKKEYRQVLLKEINLYKGAQLCIASRDSNQLIGDIYLKNEDNILYLGYTIAPDYARRGYITEAIKDIIEYAGQNNYSEIRCTIEHENQPSISLIKKIGFKEIEKNYEELIFSYRLCQDS